MKRLIKLVGVLAAASCVAGPAAPQGLQRGADPEGALINELIVTGRMPGPAWWRVSNGDAVVWVLGFPAGLPKGTVWNEKPLQDRLGRAKGLILPPQVRVGPLKAIAFFITHRKVLKSSAPLEQSLPDREARRFAAARTSLGQPAKRYTGWKPAVAGVMLDSDMRRSVKLDAGQPLDRIRALAREAHLRERRAATYDGAAVLNTLTTMSDQAQVECLDDALDEVEAGPARVRSAAEGWAHGDVRAALAMQRGYDRCFAALPLISALLERGHADMADAVAQALAQPGESVAVVDLRALLATGGVLDRLRARGFKVATPGTAGN